MSFLSRMHRAAHGDLAGYGLPAEATGPDLDAARAEGFAAENARIAERAAAIRADRFTATDPARLAAALALAPSRMSIAEIKTRVAGVFDPQTLTAKVAAMWAPRPEGDPDPFAAADQTGKPDAQAGWSRAIAAAQPDHAVTAPSPAGQAVASGGPHSPHRSAFQE